MKKIVVKCAEGCPFLFPNEMEGYYCCNPAGPRWCEPTDIEADIPPDCPLRNGSVTVELEKWEAK